jgi:hypothetical protein
VAQAGRKGGAGSGKEPVVSRCLLSSPPYRAMSHKILLFLAVLILGLATSQHQDKVPCKTVSCSA